METPYYESYMGPLILDQMPEWHKRFTQIGIQNLSSQEAFRDIPPENIREEFMKLVVQWRPFFVRALRDYATANQARLPYSNIDKMYHEFFKRRLENVRFKFAALFKTDHLAPERDTVARIAGLQRAFQTTFDDRWGGLDQFIENVGKNAAEWNDKKYFAPYMALVQSSGTGKSRYVYEYGRFGWLIYLCLRDESSSGFPLRTPILADILQDPQSLTHLLRGRASFQFWMINASEQVQILAF